MVTIESCRMGPGAVSVKRYSASRTPVLRVLGLTLADERLVADANQSCERPESKVFYCRLV